MPEIKEPTESYEVAEDGGVLHILEYGPEDEFILAESWDYPNYTQIPNQLLGTWIGKQFIIGQMADMSNAELRVALALCRLTFGFHREEAAAALSWLQKATGMSKQGVLDGIEALVRRGLFIKDKSPDGRNLWRKVHGGSQRSGHQLVNDVDLSSQRGGHNKERLKKERKKVPPPSEPERPKPTIAQTLRRCMTTGEDEQPISQLAGYIGQQFHSPVPAGQRTKLAMGYTEQLPGGKVRKHPSPDRLWIDDPLFTKYVDERIGWIKGNAGGSVARQRAQAVNAICQYKGGYYAWLEWKERQAPVPEEIPGTVIMGGRRLKLVDELPINKGWDQHG